MLITLSSSPTELSPSVGDSPLLTQLDGIGMMELEELERREIMEKHKEDMFRQIVANTGNIAQTIRAVSRRQFNLIVYRIREHMISTISIVIILMRLKQSNADYTPNE